MGEYGWLCGSIMMCDFAIFIINVKHAYNIIIDRGVGALGHVREVVDGFNATEKRLILVLMTTVQLSGAADYYSQTIMHT